MSTTTRSFLLSSAAMVTLLMSVACGDEPPTQEEYNAQALTLQQTHQDAGPAGACTAPASGRGAACDACLNKNCCTLFAACEKDVQCKAVDQCVANCQKQINPQAADARAQYNACGNACYQNNPKGVQPFAAASTCVDNCKASCP